jgi:hypothetical protein
MDITKFTQSRSFTVILIVIAVLFGLSLAFGLGVSVGFHKARFSYQWGENYDRNFGGPKRGIIGIFGGSNFMNSHGISGSIMKIDGSTVVIRGRNNVEMTVLVTDKTIIRMGNQNLKVSDLKIDENVIIIGNPDNSGQIQVELMRVLPTPLPTPAVKPSSSVNY